MRRVLSKLGRVRFNSILPYSAELTIRPAVAGSQRVYCIISDSEKSVNTPKLPYANHIWSRFCSDYSYHRHYPQQAFVMYKPNVVFVLGGPGAGKGTQCSKIVQEYGFVHLSAGDLLREERNKPGSEYGELIEGHIQNGTIVPVEITCSLIQRAMERSAPIRNFLIDGFPRNQNNLDGWTSVMSDKVNILCVLFFDCAEEICVERCLKRGEAGSGRTDDNPDSMRKRILTYMNDTMPIINHFFELGLVRKLDAGKDADSVFGDVKGVFTEFTEMINAPIDA